MQAMKVNLLITLRNEDRLTAIAAMTHMLSGTLNNNTRTASHGMYVLDIECVDDNW